MSLIQNLLTKSIMKKLYFYRVGYYNHCMNCHFNHILCEKNVNDENHDHDCYDDQTLQKYIEAR